MVNHGNLLIGFSGLSLVHFWEGQGWPERPLALGLELHKMNSKIEKPVKESGAANFSVLSPSCSRSVLSRLFILISRYRKRVKKALLVLYTISVSCYYCP